AAAMLDRALHGGRAGRVYRRLVLEQQIAVDAEGGIHYPVGDLFDYNGPTLMVTRLLHKPEYSADQTIAAYDQVLDEMKEKGITSEELEPIKVKFRSNYFSMLEGGHGASIPRYGLMHLLACFTLFRSEGNHFGRVGAHQSEIPLELLFHAGGRPRRIHSALRFDAPARVFHAL